MQEKEWEKIGGNCFKDDLILLSTYKSFGFANFFDRISTFRGPFSSPTFVCLCVCLSVTLFLNIYREPLDKIVIFKN